MSTDPRSRFGRKPMFFLRVNVDSQGVPGESAIEFDQNTHESLG